MTIVIYLLLAALGLVLTITKLEVDTDPGRMISSELEFRKHFADLNKTFPQFDNIFVVVIDAENADQGRQTARYSNYQLRDRIAVPPIRELAER